MLGMVGLFYVIGAVVLFLIVPAVVLLTSRESLTPATRRAFLKLYLLVVALVVAFALLLDWTLDGPLT